MKLPVAFRPKAPPLVVVAAGDSAAAIGPNGPAAHF